jgi:YidC/Oxa1 family membrane protein insertase
MAKLRSSGSTDKLAMQQVMVKQQDLLKEVGVNPFDAVFASVAQIVVQFGFFIGLRRMCTLPVEQLKEGGIGYLLDLTVPDPFYILPIVTTALINVQLGVSSTPPILAISC